MRAHIYSVESKSILTEAFYIESGVTALNSIEIYGSKINALNNRAVVRDLYDVWKLVKSGEYCPELLFDDQEIIDRIIRHPMARWKAAKQK